MRDQTGRYRELIAGYLDAMPPSRVRTFFCGEVFDVLAIIEETLSQRPDVALMTVPWKHAEGLEAGIDRIVEGLSRAALARWPDWHGRGTNGGLNQSWLKRAERRCQSGRLPLPTGFANETHLIQLTRTLTPNPLVITLFMDQPASAPEELLSFARAAEWTAKEGGASVVALVPECHRESPDLSAIRYGAVTIGFEEAAELPPPAPNDEPVSIMAPPLIGRPHPDSPGEMLLAGKLQADTELGPLFRFNEWVEAGRDERFLVDLVWPSGKLVVEVDGYRWHTTETVFRSDRYRDYCLMTEGYLVLRLPHDEVIADVGLQVEKIRDMVRFIQTRDGE